MSSTLCWTAVIERYTYPYKILIVDHLFGHSNQSLLFIFIQGTYLLNDHQVTLTHRYNDDSSANNYNNSKKSHTTNHREYFHQPTNELRLRDWDCYKVKINYVLIHGSMQFFSSVVYKISNDVIIVLIVIYRVKVCGKKTIETIYQVQ